MGPLLSDDARLRFERDAKAYECAHMALCRIGAYGLQPFGRFAPFPAWEVAADIAGVLRAYGAAAEDVDAAISDAVAFRELDRYTVGINLRRIRAVLSIPVHLSPVVDHLLTILAAAR